MWEAHSHIRPPTNKPVTVKITDRNRDGRISKHELRKGLRETLGGNVFLVFFESRLAARNADSNGDGYISNEEMDVLKNYASHHWNIDLIVNIVDVHGGLIPQAALY